MKSFSLDRIPLPPLPDRANSWALFLDVDGTLLEFASSPGEVHASNSLIDLLERLQQRLHGAMAFLSGRTIETLDELFAPLRLPSAGLHGFERRDGRGNIERLAIDRNNLQIMRAACLELGVLFPDVLVEDKGYSIAFHFDPDKFQQVLLRSRLDLITRASNFSLLTGHNVYEVHPPGVKKGEALTRFLQDKEFSGRLPIFIGDDFTDRSALAAAYQHQGYGIQVGSRMPRAARFGLPDPSAVLQWLHRWEEQLS